MASLWQWLRVCKTFSALATGVTFRGTKTFQHLSFKSKMVLARSWQILAEVSKCCCTCFELIGWNLYLVTKRSSPSQCLESNLSWVNLHPIEHFKENIKQGWVILRKKLTQLLSLGYLKSVAQNLEFCRILNFLFGASPIDKKGSMSNEDQKKSKLSWISIYAG